MTTTLRLGHSLATLRPTLHNGPGWRIGIWVQGCSLLCTENCLNPHYLPAGGGFAYDIDEIVAAFEQVRQRAHDPVEGITVLGGEPSDQIEPLTVLLGRVQSLGLTTMVYTGYTIEALKRKFFQAADALLAYTDLLKDGPFREDKYQPDLAWRGSANQRLHCLSARYTAEQLAETFRRQGKGFSIIVTPNGTVSVSGLQNRAAAEAAEERVRKIGH
jgi:anaerobic ribonucleoside-triphosphate reductase activating protein